MKTKRIYVYQFYAWWSLSPDAFIRMCENVVNGDGDYNLDESGKRLKTPPYKNIWSYQSLDEYGEPTREHEAKAGYVLYEYLCDWTVEQFETELAALGGE